MGKKDKKIPVTKFVSDKTLNKIKFILDNSDNIETNYERIEDLLEDDFDVIDLGTNRIVFKSKKKKYEDLIFKVAGDEHGIEANYREFYNGDLDKHLTFSYSISKNGVFIVQERVQRMYEKDMKKRKDDVKKMLKSLSKKILLVDCRLSNFKNFGIRKNGDVCLLDHGDTVPLPKYQGQNIVNADEESCVSLRCKKMKNALNTKNLEPCGGKLEYDDSFSYFICKKCGQTSSINDAYREFYGDARQSGAVKSTLIVEKGFDPDEWKKHIREYCISTMGRVADNKNNNNEGEIAMKTTTINNKTCREIKGYFIPEPTMLQKMKYNSMKIGEVSPKEYLEYIGENPEDYKATNVNEKDIIVTETPKKENNMNKKLDMNKLEEVQNYIINHALEIGNYNTYFDTDELSKRFPGYPVKDEIFMGTIRKNLAAMDETCGVKYFKDDDGNVTQLSVRIISRCQHKNTINKEEDNFKEVSVDDFDIPEIVNESNDINDFEDNDESNSNLSYDEEDISDSESEDSEDEYEDKYVRDYASSHNSTIVNDIEDSGEYPGKTLSFTQSDIDSSLEEFEGNDCVVIKKYFVPMDIIQEYYNDETGTYDIPKKIKNVLKAHNLSPKKYKVGEPEIESNNVSAIEETTNDYHDMNMADLDKKAVEVIHKLKDEAVKSGATIHNHAYINIPAADIVMGLYDIGYPDICENKNDRYYTKKDLGDNKISITIDCDQMQCLYMLLSPLEGRDDEYGPIGIGVDYYNQYICIFDPSFNDVDTNANDAEISESEESESLDLNNEEKINLNSINNNIVQTDLKEEERLVDFDNSTEFSLKALDDKITRIEESLAETNNKIDTLISNMNAFIYNLKEAISTINSSTRSLNESINELKTQICELSINNSTDLVGEPDRNKENYGSDDNNYGSDDNVDNANTSNNWIKCIRQDSICVFELQDIKDLTFAVRNNGKIISFDIAKLFEPELDRMNETISNVISIETNTIE